MRGAALAVLMAVSAAAGPAPLRAADAFVSEKVAFEHGLSAYRAGYYEIAVPALSFAAQKGHYWAKVFLDRIDAEQAGAQIDNGAEKQR